MDKKCETTISEGRAFDEQFPIVEVSELFLNDRWFEHRPKTKAQQRLKNSLEEIIKSGMPDFRRPAMDPSKKDGKMTFSCGNRPWVGNSPKFWEALAQEVMPSKNSRLGTLKQYDAFLGTIIKYLVEKQGYRVSKAWKYVCDNSCQLGHYWNSRDGKFELESTGNRKVDKWYDLANTSKIVQKDNDNNFVLVGGNYKTLGDQNPLAYSYIMTDSHSILCTSVGWIVLDV